MPAGTTLRRDVLAARERLAESREKLRKQHQAGSPGVQVCACLTDAIDTIVLEMLEAALADLPGAGNLRGQFAVVPHGGYGRRDIAPYSDVDLMILHAPRAAASVAPLAGRLMRDLFDVGLDVGHSVRSTADVRRLAGSDPVIFTSLVESRFLAGSVSLYTDFARALQHDAQRYARRMIPLIEQSRRQERAKYGETVYLLRPNVKRSRGGLRDAQLVRWVGFARYGMAEPDGLERLGALAARERRSLRSSVEFLLRLRNEMHFHAGRSCDVLDRAEQARLAGLFELAGDEGLLPVEVFMREYFQRTREIRYISANFVSTAQPKPRVMQIVGPLLSRRLTEDYRVGPTHINATAAGLAKLRSNPTEVLQLAELASRVDKRIAHNTWIAVRDAAAEHDTPPDPETMKQFLALLERPARLEEMLRRLHELEMLEKIIPEMAHARGLLQYNDYHQYTVDEHCIRAVGAAAALAGDTGPLGEVYRRIRKKHLLHLALLLHDLGKGRAGDHSDVGREIAQSAARRFGLSEEDAETLEFLVYRHLYLSHLAFRRDVGDERAIVELAVTAGSPEWMQMLLVLTCADLEAVGPGVLNDWKTKVLLETYERAMRHLAGDGPGTNVEARLDWHRDQVRACLGTPRDPWFDRQLAALPGGYLSGTPAEQVGAELRQLAQLETGEVKAWGRYLPESGVMQYTVGTSESVTPGVFHKLTGALTSAGLEILSAEIYTLADGVVLDRFVVDDPDHAGHPPPERIDEICRRLVDWRTSDPTHPPTFRRTWNPRAAGGLEELPQTLPTRIRIDNSTSLHHTILDIFTHDRPGLLYTVASKLYELGLSVHVAKIGTYLDQVVDVFYVTDAAGRKVEDEPRLHRIREELMASVNPPPAPANRPGSGDAER